MSSKLLLPPPITLFLITLYLITLGCSSDNEEICYSFDQKQCQVDPWFLLDDETPLQERVQDYLQSESINVKMISVEVIFRTTCLACEVCPDDKRYSVVIDKGDMSIIESLNLLNLSLEECD